MPEVVVIFHPAGCAFRKIYPDRYLQMQKTFFILFISVTNLMFSQVENGQLEFRKLTGKAIDEKGLPMPGQSIVIKGTEIGAQTDFDGKFCLAVPKDRTIYLEISCCFVPMYQEIKPKMDKIKIRIGRGRGKSKRAINKWTKISSESKTELAKVYASSEFKKVAENICR